MKLLDLLGRTTITRICDFSMGVQEAGRRTNITKAVSVLAVTFADFNDVDAVV